MACKSCNDPIIPDPTPHRNSCGVPSPVVVVNSGTQVIQFASVVIPSSQGDETSIPPVNGRYRNAVVSYEASGNVYLYTSDGIAVKLTPEQITNFDLLSGRPQYAGKEMTSATNIPDVDEAKADLEQLIQDTETGLNKAIQDEANARSDGDSDLSNGIKAEAEEREAAVSDLEEKIASQGTDVSDLSAKLDGKQDKLTAGYGISIAEDTDTISVSLDQKKYVFANPLPDQPSEEDKNKIFFTEASEGSSEYNAYLWATELNKWLGVTTFHADIDLADYATTAYVDQEVQKSTSEITDFSASLTQLVNEETTAREQGDSNLQTQIDGFQSSLEAETTARSEADAGLQSSISTLTSDLAAETTARENAVTALQSSVTTLQSGLSTETSERTAADNNLQGQIDALTSASDVVDVVGTKAALDSYDTSSLTDKDIIKVLNDESENNQTTYYRWDTGTSQFDLIGAQGPYYTISAADQAIQTAVSAEATARQAADSTLTASVEGVQNSLASEVTARQNADSELEASITSISGDKQDALTTTQVAAVNSGITADKVATYDGYGDSISDNASNITSLSGRVTAVESTTSTLTNSVTTLDNSVSNLQTSKQDNLSASQLSAVNSGITSAKVSTYDGYATGKADVATTLAGYGITDAYTKTEVDAKIPAEYTTLAEMPFQFPSSPNIGLPFNLQAGSGDVIPDGVTPVDDPGTPGSGFSARYLYTDVNELNDGPSTCVYLESGKTYRVSLVSSAQVESKSSGNYSFPHIETFAYATHNGTQTIIYNNTNYVTQTVPGVLSVEITPSASGNYYFGVILYSKSDLSTGNTSYFFSDTGMFLPFIRVRVEEKK